jgi:hypothetical protein
VRENGGAYAANIIAVDSYGLVYFSVAGVREETG